MVNVLCSRIDGRGTFLTEGSGVKVVGCRMGLYNGNRRFAIDDHGGQRGCAGYTGASGSVF